VLEKLLPVLLSAAEDHWNKSVLKMVGATLLSLVRRPPAQRSAAGPCLPLCIVRAA
jgi:hypothetical protein